MERKVYDRSWKSADYQYDERFKSTYAKKNVTHSDNLTIQAVKVHVKKSFILRTQQIRDHSQKVIELPDTDGYHVEDIQGCVRLPLADRVGAATEGAAVQDQASSGSAGPASSDSGRSSGSAPAICEPSSSD
eukprot:2569692-Pyramimonas_sp.AAC.1